MEQPSRSVSGPLIAIVADELRRHHDDMLATAMAFGVVSGFVVFVTFFAVLLYKSRIEERFMAGHFPETYTAYMKKTKALVPFVF